MTYSSKRLTLGLAALILFAPVAESFARSGSVTREGPRGGSVSAQGARYGRAGAGSVEATGPRGGSYEAQGARVGRYGAGSASASGPRGGSYSASGVTTPRYRAGTATATGPQGKTYSASGASARYGTVTRSGTVTTTTTFTGYRSGYVYVGGVYKPATVTVNSVYVAPVGPYTGWRVVAQPVYVKYPVYATYPVETSVQVELKRRGYYAGPIDGQIGPGSSKSIAAYQSASGLKVTGTINQALLVSLGIVKA